MVELSIHELAGIVGGHLSLGSMPPIGGLWEPLGRIVPDSGQVNRGDVFWSVRRGPRPDLDQALEAFSRHALGVVVADHRLEPWAGQFSLRVQDGLQALCRLASWVRIGLPGLVVAVAGGEARPKSAAMLRHVLQQRPSAPVPRAADSSLVTLALEMLDWEAGDDCVVAEICAAEESELNEISHLCCPHIVVITGSHNSHCDPTGSRAAFAGIQTRLLSESPSDGLALLDGDDPLLRSQINQSPVPILWVGRSVDCDIRVTDIRHHDERTSVTIDGHVYDLPSCAGHDLLAAQMVIATGRVLGRTSSEIAESLMIEAGCPQPKQNIDRVPPFATALREAGATLPPGLERYTC